MNETVCRVCGQAVPLTAEYLGVCPACARAGSEAALRRALEVHGISRHLFGLPMLPPRTEGGVTCALCARRCRLGEGERGYCNLRAVQGGRLVHIAGVAERGLLRWYRDPLPTNCCADFVCAGHARRGMHNLAVFYASCSFNCLYCQNWDFRAAHADSDPLTSAEALAAQANARTYCVCFFGGDPAPQMPHALAAARLLAERGVVVCWETAGAANPHLMDRAVRYALETGGCVKFDLKAFDKALHQVLTGASNRQTLENFARAAALARQRPDPPLVIAATLLVPGYVDAAQVGKIARFIADLDPDIPYTLLGFGPNFTMPDLPPTSVRHAEAALEAARAAGLRRVHVGNRHLLSREY